MKRKILLPVEKAKQDKREPVQLRLPLDQPAAKLDFYADERCPACHALLVKQRECWKCLNCGYGSCGTG